MSMRTIYRKIARQNGVTVGEVKREIQTAVNTAWMNPSNQFIRASQRKVQSIGNIPTADEFICHAARELIKDRGAK